MKKYTSHTNPLKHKQRRAATEQPNLDGVLKTRDEIAFLSTKTKLNKSAFFLLLCFVFVKESFYPRRKQ